MNVTRHYSPAEIAERYAVAVDKVLGWIARGELRAVNVATRAFGRPRWRISPEALEQFERARANQVPTRAPRKTRKCDAEVIQFYS